MTKTLTPRKKKTVRTARRLSVYDLMPLDTWNKAKHYVHYEIESKDWLSKIKEHIKKNYNKEIVIAINKLPDWKIGSSHWATTAIVLEKKPELVPDPYKDGFDKLIKKLAEEGKQLVILEKAQVKTKKVAYVPTIQERVREATEDKVDEIDQWVDDWLRDPKANPLKDKMPLPYFKGKEVNLGHARFINDWYKGPFEELEELVNLPAPAKQDEMQKQLAEGYDHLTKAQQKELHEFYKRIMQAVEILRAEKKQTKAPRKVKQKSAAELVKKLKFKPSEPQYGIASVNPADLIGSTVAVVFNTKTRKIGVYYAETNCTFQVSGTSLKFFNEAKSLQKTIRKPEDVLPNWKKVTKHKVGLLFEYLKTTDTKMNGRFNEDTVILKVFQ